MKKRILPVALLCALPVILFRDSLFSGRALYLDDLEAYSYPVRFFQYQMGVAGKIFKWNPFVFSGTPFLADPQSSLFYPPGWIFFLLPPENALPIFLAVHFALAGILTYIFLGRYHLDTAARLGGAVVYMLSGFAVLHSIHPGIVAAYSLIPLGLILCRKVIEGCSLWSSCLLGMFLAVHLFIGALQMTLIMSMALIVYSLFNLSGKPRGASLLKIAALLTFPVIIAALLIQVQFLPSLEFYRQTSRSTSMSFNELTSGSLGFQELVMMLIPDRYGHPLSPAPFSGGLFYWEICVFVGIVPFLLAIYSLFSADSRQKKERVAFLVMAVLAIFLAMGKHNPLYVHMTSLPVINSFRVPMRFIVMFILSLSYLTATGIQNLPDAFAGEEKSVRMRKALFFSSIIIFFVIVSAALIFARDAALTIGTVEHLLFGTAGLLFMWAAARRRESAVSFQYCIAAVLAASAVSFALTWNPTVPREYYSERKAIFSRLSGKTPPVRVHYYPPFEMKESLNLPSTCDVSNIVGYNPLMLSDYLQYLIYSDYGRMLTGNASSKITSKGNIFGLQRPDAPLTRLLSLDGTFTFRKTEHGYVTSYTHFSRSVPRVFLAHDKRVISDREKLLSTLSSPGFKAEEEILFLEEPPPAAMPPGRPESGKGSGHESAEITYFSPDLISINCRVVRPGYLFLGEIFYPGWKALVDGNPRTVLRGDYIFRVVQIFPGEQNVQLRFSPDSFTTGYLISGIAFIACVVIAVFSCRRR